MFTFLIRARALFPVLLTAAVLLTSCAVALPPEDPSPAVIDFNQRLRWKDLTGASRHLTASVRDPFLEQFRPLENLQIADMTLESIELQEPNRAVTWTVMEYYLFPSITVKKFRFRLEWEYTGGKPPSGDWLISSPFPPFP